MLCTIIYITNPATAQYGTYPYTTPPVTGFQMHFVQRITTFSAQRFSHHSLLDHQASLISLHMAASLVNFPFVNPHWALTSTFLCALCAWQQLSQLFPSAPSPRVWGETDHSPERPSQNSWDWRWPPRPSFGSSWGHQRHFCSFSPQEPPLIIIIFHRWPKSCLTVEQASSFLIHGCHQSCAVDFYLCSLTFLNWPSSAAESSFLRLSFWPPGTRDCWRLHLLTKTKVKKGLSILTPFTSRPTFFIALQYL